MWIHGSVLFFILVGSSLCKTPEAEKESDRVKVQSRADSRIFTAEPGDDVTLRCQDIEQILVLEWIRSDLKEDEYVFKYRSGGVDPDHQHKSFWNRVFLLDPQMTDGDLSVVLENVNTEDSGTYKCKVLKRNDTQREPKLISSISLQVSPGEKGGQDGGKEEKDNKNGVSLIVLIVLAGLLAGLVLAVVTLWIYKKKNGSNRCSRASINLLNPQRDLLISDSKPERNRTNRTTSLRVISDPELDLHCSTD